MEDADALRIRREADDICQPYKIRVAYVDRLPADEGFAVTLWIQPTLSPNGPEVAEIRPRLERIRGVTKIWVLLYPDAG